MLEMLLLCSAVILVVIGLRLLFRNKVSSVLVYSLWLPAAAGLLLIPLAHLLTGAFSDFAAHTVGGVPVICFVGLVWLAGATALTTWLVLTWRSLRRDLRKNAEPFSCPESPVPVWISPSATTPCLFGLLRPAIYLTPDVAEEAESCRHVLAHELTHLRHGDHVWSFVRRLCLCVHWFHPLVWLAAQMSRQDSELACDEGALKRLGEEQRLAYGKTIVDLAAASSKKSRISSPEADAHKARTEVQPKEPMGKRKQKPLLVWGLGLLAVLVAGSVAWLLHGAIVVQEVILESIAVVQEPYRCHYVYGESLDTRGLKLQLTYSDGTTQTVTEGFTCSPERMEIVGKQTITVTYGENVMKFDVDIGEASKTGTCGENLKWTLTKQGSLIITGTGAMGDYQKGTAPWSNAPVIRNVSLSEGVTAIGAYAFADCGAKSIRVPDSVVSMGEGAFSFCLNLTSCHLSENLTRLPAKTFWQCWYLEEVTLPAGLTVIEEAAFESCLKLEEISLPEKLESIGKGAFRFCENLKQIIIPGSVKEIRSSAFNGCKALQQVQLQKGIKEIGSAAFSGCEVLQPVQLPEGLLTLGTGVFFGCELFREIYIPASVEQLEYDTFNRMNNLEAIWVAPGNAQYVSDECGVLYTKDYKQLVQYPRARRGSYQVAQGCQVIGNRAFSYCEISQLTLPDTLRRIEANAFLECKGGAQLTLPASVEYVEASAILHGGAGRLTFLNPQCQIDSKNYKATYSYIIYGYRDSTAWQYAQKYGFKFEEIS